MTGHFAPYPDYRIVPHETAEGWYQINVQAAEGAHWQVVASFGNMADAVTAIGRMVKGKSQSSFERLEALNVEICELTGAGKGADTTYDAILRYQAMLVARKDEVRKAITEARADTQRYVFGRVSPHHFIDSMAAVLTRALIASAKVTTP